MTCTQSLWQIYRTYPLILVGKALFLLSLKGLQALLCVVIGYQRIVMTSCSRVGIAESTPSLTLGSYIAKRDNKSACKPRVSLAEMRSTSISVRVSKRAAPGRGGPDECPEPPRADWEWPNFPSKRRTSLLDAVSIWTNKRFTLST